MAHSPGGYLRCYNVSFVYASSVGVEYFGSAGQASKGQAKAGLCGVTCSRLTLVEAPKYEEEWWIKLQNILGYGYQKIKK
jgi:hypothetical protein